MAFSPAPFKNNCDDIFIIPFEIFTATNSAYLHYTDVVLSISKLPRWFPVVFRSKGKQ